MTRRALALVAALAIPAVSAASFGVEVLQRGRAFSRSELRVARGELVVFRNVDEFLHQIYVRGAGFSFDSMEQEPGSTVDIRFTKAGVFAVRCEIHPRMMLTVTVE